MAMRTYRRQCQCQQILIDSKSLDKVQPFSLNYVKVGMMSSTFFLLMLGVITLIYGPKAVQYQLRITKRWKVYWRLVNRSKAALRNGDQQLSQQLRNLSKGHLTKVLQMQRRRRLVAALSMLLVGGLYGAMNAMGLIAL